MCQRNVNEGRKRHKGDGILKTEAFLRLSWVAASFVCWQRELDATAAPNYHVPFINTDERLFLGGKSILPGTMAWMPAWGLFLFMGEEGEG